MNMISALVGPSPGTAFVRPFDKSHFVQVRIWVYSSFKVDTDDSLCGMISRQLPMNLRSDEDLTIEIVAGGRRRRASACAGARLRLRRQATSQRLTRGDFNRGYFQGR
jgi:hypothetical protein